MRASPAAACHRSHSLDWYARAAGKRAAGIDIEALSDARLLPSPGEHYLTGTYPPLKAMGPADAVSVIDGATAELNLYIHLPFCRQRCTFCHFAKEISASDARIARYLDALAAEIATAARLFGPRQIRSAYLGGGTPSVLPPDDLNRLLAAVSESFPWTADTEVTFELHPQVVRDTPALDRQIRVLSGAGVNRITFGIQSLDDHVLRILNRGHTAAEAIDLIRVLQHGPFSNVSVDLMYGLPHETTESWFSTLCQIVGEGVQKMNIFPLFLKATDPVSWLYSRKPEVFPGRDQRLSTHLITDQYLRDSGFTPGPVLYYSRAGQHSAQQESKFNDIDSVNLLGLGVSAFGYLGGTQYYNQCDIDSYITAALSGRPPIWRAAHLDGDERSRREAMFALRSAGMNRAAFRGRFGDWPEIVLPQLARFARLGLIRLAGDTWVTTDIGAYCVDGMAAALASDAVRRRVDAANAAITEPRKSLLEQHDYSPLGRTPPGPRQVVTAGQAG